MMDLSDAGLRERLMLTIRNYSGGGRAAAISQSRMEQEVDEVLDALCAAARAEQRERDARIAETKVVCEIHTIDLGERDPLCAITASTAAVCITHGRDIAAAIRTQEGKP